MSHLRAPGRCSPTRNRENRRDLCFETPLRCGFKAVSPTKHAHQNSRWILEIMKVNMLAQSDIKRDVRI